MRRSKLFRLFSVLSSWDLTNWRTFLCSPYMNKRKDVIKLFDLIVKERKKKSPNYSKENAFSVVYPNEVYKKKDIVKLMSILNGLGEKYLAIRRFEEEESLLKIYTTKELRKLKMEKDFEKTIKKTHVLLDKEVFRNSDYLRKKYVLDYELYDFLESRKRSGGANLQQVISAFDQYFIASKLELSFHVFSQKIASQKVIDVGILDELFSLIEKKPSYLDNPALAIYYNIYKFSVEPEKEEYFLKSNELFTLYIERFYPNEQRNILLMLTNYCIQKINKGIMHYDVKLFELKKIGIKTGTILENNTISRSSFTNIVSIALRLQKFDWVEKFMEDYKDKIYAEDKRNTIDYNNARLLYYKKNYEEVIAILSNFHDKSVSYNLRARFMLMLVYFSLESYDELMERLISTTEKYLRRKELSKKEFYKNFIRYFKRIKNLAPYDHEKKRKLIEKIKKEKKVFDKELLLKVLGVN